MSRKLINIKKINNLDNDNKQTKEKRKLIVIAKTTFSVYNFIFNNQFQR